MNTKKNKNKPKHNKPQNPHQKTESDSQNEDTKEDKEEISKIPEIINSEENMQLVSEVVSPVVETKVSESDTPKKPKRNRGKKKKSEKEEDFDDGVEEKQPELGTDDIKVSSNTPEDEVKLSQEKSTDIVEITPAARKKKNKNKKQSEQVEKAEEEVKIAPLKKEDLADVKIVTLIPVTTESEDTKSKKKNKKKKRTDSERSDKADEVISCTAAFQKLLEGGDKKEGKKDIKLEEGKPLEESSVYKEAVVEQAIKLESENIIEKDIIKPTFPVGDETLQTRDEEHDSGGRSKKKNKKDKKCPPKTDSDIEKSSEYIVVTVTEQKPTNHPSNFATGCVEILKEELDKDHKSAEITTIEKPQIEKEKSPKPKAKIAKPVDKKHKNKSEGSSLENLTEKNLITTEETSLNIAETSKQKTTQEETVKLINVTDLNMFQPRIPTDLPEILTEVKTEIKEQLITAPKLKVEKMVESGVVAEDKKLKQKQAETVKVKEAIDAEVNPTGAKTDDNLAIIPSNKPEKTLHKKTEELKAQSAAEPVKQSSQNAPIPLGFEVSIPIQPAEINILATPEIPKIQKTAFTESEVHKTELPVPSTETSKKRKKSPILKSVDKPFETGSNITEQVSTTKTAKTVKEDKNKEKIKTDSLIGAPKDIKEESKDKKESLFDLPPLEDIEIRSIKAEESEGSVCDIVPDVHYPRARSQLLDDNNNTVIRDVTATDVKLSIPFVTPDTPLIQGSGETPLMCPELIPLGIKITEVEPASTKHNKDIASKLTEDTYTTKVEEKTDLKSKVMDVNQGMEELRKSIERSLAELSAIEKNEKNAEDQFAKAQSKLEQIQELASKKSSEKKEMAEAEQKQGPKSGEKKTKHTEQPVILTQKPVMEIGSINPEQVTLEQLLLSKAEEIENKTPQMESKITEIKPEEKPTDPLKTVELPIPTPPPLPARKDNKGKGKKKKGNRDSEQSTTAAITPSTTVSESSSTTTSEAKKLHDTKKDEKTEEKTDSQKKGKQQSDAIEEDYIIDKDSKDSKPTSLVPTDFEPIESFEDAMTSSADDVNKTFEIIANEANQCDQTQNPEINITAPVEDDDNSEAKDAKINPVSQPKNLLGHPDIPARLNKTDYKKEKDKIPNNQQAKVKIKDEVPIEITKQSKESQTENKRRFIKDKTVNETICSVVNENEEYIYKYSFRKVFLPSACHVCKKDLKQARVPCNFCSLVFYCSSKHKDEDYSQHQALCFAVSTIIHLKEQKHIYADAKNITGQDYRLLRMQMIVSCEKVLKRRLVPWEQEALLYPRVCSDVGCREWRQGKLKDCEGCGQIAYCSDHPDHLPISHQRWCKSYSLYHRLVVYQQTKGRLEPKMPSRVMAELYQIPEKLNEVLASMYEEKIDMTDIQYAALTQIATAPLTAAYCQQLYTSKMNTIYANGTIKKSSFTIHVVGAELQFEADALNKWEVFFLHLRPDIKDLRVVLIGTDLNPSNLPLDLLGKVKLCENCRQNKRRVVFEFQDSKTYYEYWSSDFSSPDLVCAFNPNIQRSSVFNGKDTWPSTIKCIMKLRTPFIVTSHTMNELSRDIARIKQCTDSDLNIISEPKCNAFASVRPDRNFISDDEMPLLFKNFCFSVVCGSI